MYQKHLTHKHFSKPRTLPNGFTISHYAGEVTYDSANFIEKNRDFVVAELLSLLEHSPIEFVRNLIKSQEKEPLIQPGAEKKSLKDKLTKSSKSSSTSTTSRFKFVSVSSQFRVLYFFLFFFG